MSALIGAIGRCFPEPLSRCFLPTSSSTRSGEGSECRVTIGDASCKVEGPRTEIGNHSCTVEGPLLSCSGRALGSPQCPFGPCFRRYEALRPGDGPSCSLHPTGSGVLRDQDNQQRYVRPAVPRSRRAFWTSTSKACMTAWRQSATLCRHLCVRCGAQGGTCCISISQRQQARRCVRCSETALVVTMTFIICSWVIRSEQDGCSFDNDDVVVRAFHP